MDKMNLRNILAENKYLISLELQDALEKGCLENDKFLDKNSDDGIYLVMFRILNKNSNALVYNYIYYPNIFYTCLSVYLILKDKYINSMIYREWGDYLTVVDYKFNNCNLEDKFVLNNYNEHYRNLLSSISNSEYIVSNYHEVFNLINRMVYLADNKLMSDLIDLAFRRCYIEFIRKILSSYNDYDSLEKRLENDKNKVVVNLINGCLFVVKDLNLLIKTIGDKNYNVNQGPQKWRGQVNSINNFLNCLDMDFRFSIYNHNRHHVYYKNIDKRLELSKSKFSFNNIHMNLGKVRWYSTKRMTKINTRITKGKLISPEVLTSRAEISIEEESLVFNQLSNYLKDSPINEETQMKIERFLLDYSYISYEKKKDNSSPIDYSLISNNLTKLLKNNEVILNSYIDRVRNKIFNKEPKNQKELVQYRLSFILKELDNSLVISIMYGRLLRIISNFNRLNYNNKTIYIAVDIGKDLIGNFYYSLYYKHMLKDIKVLLGECDRILNKNNPLKVEFIKFALDNVKKSMNKSDKSDLFIYVKDLVKKIKNHSDNNNIIFDLNSVDKVVNYTLSDWKKDNENIINIYNNDELKNLLGARIIDWMLDTGLVKIELKVTGKKERDNTIIPTEDVLNTLKDKNKLIHLPQRIPMIVKPKPYYREIINGKSVERLGGYLLNDERITYNLIIDNWELKEPSIIKDKNVVFDLANNMSSVGFKINKDILDFINTYGIKYNLVIDKNYQDPLLTKPKLIKSERVKLESFLSRKVLQENILGLAKVFSNVFEFFIPVRLDYRGRMYCISEYLNYQSNELAKSLLLFSNPEKILKSDNWAIGYLKAFGANCYGNKLDKKSWNDRIKWVDDNIKNIINFRNGELITHADNKLLFVAFCLEYNRWLQALSNNETPYFETYLPIQLDATCNGYQHLSLLSLDYKLAKELNLTKSTWGDIPKDFYSFISTKLTDYFRNKLNSNNLNQVEKETYIRLSELILVRTIVKKAIMNIPYNVSIPTMIEYIKDNFLLCDSSINKDISNFQDEWYQFKDDSNIKLKLRDFTAIAMGLREVLNNDVFKLNKLLKYLKDIAKICTTLDLVIPWALPSGLVPIQSYLSTDEVRLKPFSYSKKSFILKIPNKKKYNINRQIRAFMPNLVHSLDATSLALLIDLYFNSISEVKNVFAVHDCFAVTANNVENIMQLLKLVYIKIYSENNYLRQLDRQIKEHIKLHYGDKCFNEETRIINIEDLPKMKFPNINAVLDTELDADFILNSSYIIM